MHTSRCNEKWMTNVLKHQHEWAIQDEEGWSLRESRGRATVLARLFQRVQNRLTLLTALLGAEIRILTLCPSSVWFTDTIRAL